VSSDIGSHFILGERSPGIQWIGGWVDSRAILDIFQKRQISSFATIWPSDRPARSLCWLCCHVSTKFL